MPPPDDKTLQLPVRPTQRLPVSTGTEVLPASPPAGPSAAGEPVGPAPARTEVLRGRGTEALGKAPIASRPEEAQPNGPRPGDLVRQYELIRSLGRGGMGEVFLARDTKLGRRAAIKFLHTQDPALVQRFVLEARATARCGHENIVTLYEADTFDGRPYMALEYLEGRSFADLLDEGKPLPPGRAVELMVPVLRALASAHALGIVHRDLKPENVLQTSAGVIKVLDFGIAKVLGEAADAPRAAAGGRDGAIAEGLGSLTQAGFAVGTVQYMSPEQWTAGHVDHRSDLWAAGIMLFRMLAGRHPLHPLDGMELSRVADPGEPMPRLLAAAPDVPAPLADAVDACLAKDPERRPADAAALLRALEPFLPGRIERSLKLDESPYAGLHAFQESDADRFFGRTHEIAALVARLRDQPLVTVVGPSGAGKSSFVRAGVVPALKRLGERWEAVVLRPGRSPLAALASALSRAGATTSPGAAVDDALREQELVARLAGEPGHAGAALRALARRQERRILLVVDQLEEAWTVAQEPGERRAFAACLTGIADDATSPVRVVACLRADFLGRVSEDEGLMAELGRGLFFLGSPRDDGLRDALTLPAEMAGYRFETPALVEEIVRDVRSTQGALPLLQFAASQLWEARDPARRVLTRASYAAMGGIAGALARYADSVLDGLAPPSREVAKALFLRLVTPERTRAIASVEELRALSAGGREAEALLERLAQARLVVIQKGAGGSTAEIVHESLIHGWPTLRRWLEESGEDAVFLEQLRGAARQWEAQGRYRDLLWRGELADAARRFRRRHGGRLPAGQEAFLDAVLAEQARRARRRRTLAIGGVSLLSLIVAGSLVAVVVIRGAQQEAVRQAELARRAEAAERQRAEELQLKERERAEAASLAEAERAVAVTQREIAEAERARALAAQRAAESSSAEVRRAQEAADRAARQLALRLEEEQERVRRLEAQFGSPMAEALPR